jgi:hypothetical protein
VRNLREGVLDPEVRDVLWVALVRLGAHTSRLTLKWIAPMLRDTGNRQACKGRDVLGSRLTELGYEAETIWERYPV